MHQGGSNLCQKGVTVTPHKTNNKTITYKTSNKKLYSRLMARKFYSLRLAKSSATRT